MVPAGRYEGDLWIDRPLTLRGEGRPLLEVRTRGEAAVELRRGAWCPEFGRREATTVLVLVQRGRLPLELGYRLQRPAAARDA